MKYVFALLLSLCGAFTSAAQAYNPLIRAGVYWDVIITGNSTQICGLDQGYRAFFSGVTTTSGGYQYHEMRGYRYVPVQAPGPFCPPFTLDLSGSDPLALLREDTLTRRVYFRPAAGGPDVLLYDFALAAGDTLHSEPERVVDSVRSVRLQNAQLRRISYLARFGGRSPDYLLEGIGSSFGPFCPQMAPGIGFEYRLEAVWENGVLVWGPQQFPLGTGGAQTAASLTVAVDLTTRTVSCQLPPTGTGASLMLLDATGRTILRHSLPHAAVVALPALAPGLYFYQLVADGRRVSGRWLEAGR